MTSRVARAKSAFVSNVSHELKTPLALISLFSETLESERVRTADKAREYHRIIQHECRRMTHLIDNILDFSRIEAGRKEYRFVECDLAALVADVVFRYRPHLARTGFQLTTEMARNLPPAIVDREAIAHAVLNLLDNAVKYSDDIKEIVVRVEMRTQQLAIDVVDRGIGISRSEHQKVFEKFYRIGAGVVHDVKGTGLGLALVKHIIEAHRGTVIVDSAPGRGSRFTILLPAHLKPQSDAPGLRSHRVA